MQSSTIQTPKVENNKNTDGMIYDGAWRHGRWFVVIYAFIETLQMYAPDHKIAVQFQYLGLSEI